MSAPAPAARGISVRVGAARRADRDLARPGGARGWRFLAAVWALSQAAFLLIGWVVARAWRSPDRVPTSAFVSGSLGTWAHWDGVHYLAIAVEGYTRARSKNAAFFPLYPLLTRLLALPLSNAALAGLAVSLASLIAALWCVYRVAEDGWGTASARRVVLCLVCFPTAFFFTAVYTESLFLALSAGCLWALRVRRDFILACLLAGLASATRGVGLALLLPLGFAWLSNARGLRWRGLALGFAPLGLVVYMAYLWRRFGDPLLFARVQSAQWDRHLTRPDLTLASAWAQGWKGAGYLLHPLSLLQTRTLHDSLYAGDAFALATLAFAFVMLVLGWRLLPLELSLYTLALLLPGLLVTPPNHPLMSFPRFVLVALPLFISLGALLTPRWACRVWLLLSGAAGAYLCALFASWRWVA